MALWQLIGAISIALFILEIFTPTMFFLNLAIAALITAVVAFWYVDIWGLAIIFTVLSILALVFLRPFLVKKSSKDELTGIEGKYIGNIAKAESDISSSQGVISIYGERWEARSIDNSLIPANSDVKIIKNDSLIMFVEKLQ